MPDLKSQGTGGLDPFRVGKLPELMQLRFDLLLLCHQKEGAKKKQRQKDRFHTNSIILAKSAVPIQSISDMAPTIFAGPPDVI